jgi:hypothetical protein
VPGEILNYAVPRQGLSHFIARMVWRFRRAFVIMAAAFLLCAGRKYPTNWPVSEDDVRRAWR